MQESILDRARDGMIANVGGRLRTEEKVLLSGFPGRDLAIELPHRMPGVLPPQRAIMRSRIYLVKQRTYVLVVSGRRDRVASKQADDFFESFKLISVPEEPTSSSEGADPGAVANVDSLMQEAKELPIGSVRGHAVAHVKVDLRGGYFLNAKRVSLEELRTECARLSEIGGVVFYYRENPTAEPPPEAEAVIATICEARLALVFASRDYDSTVQVAEYFLPAGAAKGKYGPN
jgi:hypothetical protein